MFRPFVLRAPVMRSPKADLVFHLFRQALQLGRLIDAIVKCLLNDEAQSTKLSVLLDNLGALSEVGVLSEPEGGDDTDLLRSSSTSRMRSQFMSTRRMLKSKSKRMGEMLAHEKERHALKHEKRLRFAIRTLMLLRRLNTTSLQQIFRMTAVRFKIRSALQ